VDSVNDAIRALMRGVVDYAGLFPPAALELRTAVREYEHYRTSPDAWMLGRFVVPAARLDALAATLDEVEPVGPGAWTVAALSGADVASDVHRVRAFNASGRNAIVDTLETKASTDDEIVAAAAFAGGELAVFVEVPVANDPAPLVAAIGRAGVHAKIRTGGVTADAFPSAPDVVRFMRCCIDADVAFKATAGLHHPLRAEYRLTYASDAPRGTMYGYLNVFLAAAFLAHGMSEDEARLVLEERDAAAFAWSDRDVAWRGRRLSADALASTRQRVATSFGSCSFREPVDDLRGLRFLV
jgi:hypothetical protein